MTKPTRKPFRRTAWSMLLGGVAGVALVFGLGAYAVSMGEPAGPGQTAPWPAGTEIAVFRPIGPDRNYLDDVNAVCTVTPQGGQPAKRLLTWGRRIQPDFAGSATITCEQPAKVLNDPLLTIANITRSSLFALPMFVALLAIPFFFPRFTLVWARHAHPYRALVTLLAGRDRSR